MEEKQCKGCEVTKPASEFHRNKGRKDGLQTKCKACAKLYHRDHYLNNKEVYLRRAAETRNDLKVSMRAFYEPLKDKPCADCNVRYPSWVMEFDHVRGKKKFSVSRYFVSRYSKEEILREIEKCDLVCANCHRLRTWRRYQNASMVEG